MTTYTWQKTSDSNGFSFPNDTYTTVSPASADDLVYSITLPTPFTFNGVNYSTVYVCTNGFVSFNNNSAIYQYTAGEIALINGVFFGTDLYLDTSLGHFIRYKSPISTTIEIYFNLQYYSGRTGTIQAKVTLYLSNHPTNSGLITIDFGTFTTSSAINMGISFASNNTLNNTSYPDLLTTRSFTSPNSIYTVTSTVTASYQNKSFSISSTQTPILSNFPNKSYVYGTSNIITQPTSNSSGTFSYTSSNTSVATLNGNTLTILSAGSTVITATQAAVSGYNSATITATYTITQVVTTLSSFTLSPAFLGYTTTVKLYPPTTTGQGVFSYTSSDQTVATISGDTVTLLKLGYSTITVNQAATTNYSSATTSATLTVLADKTSDFYYRYNNTSSNLILNDAYLSSANPVTIGLHRRFKASDFNTTSKVWTDSALGNTITASGNITTVSHIGDKQYRTTPTVSFDTTARVLFNNDTLTTYTLFVITRYNGANKGRIIDGTTANFMTGHHGAFTGISFKEGWLVAADAGFGTNFFLGTDTPTAYNRNGLTIIEPTPTNSIAWLPPLALNGTRYSQFSEGQMLDLLIYNRVLSDLEKKKVEQYLTSYYGLMDTYGNLTASYNRTPLSTETSLLVSTTASPNWIVYPTFYLAQSGVSFSMWFKTNISSLIRWSRLLDFGNGASSSNMLIGIVDGNLAISIYGVGGVCQLENVIPSCNDNAWRHLIWSISSDGLTWKIYINRVLKATITSSNYTNYASTGTSSPLHPTSILRTSNYIGKSNWTDPAYNGSIDEFRMFNNEIGLESINHPWFMNVTNPIVPIYNRPKLSTETSLLVSTTASPNWIVYPSFSIAQTGLTFAMWFQSNSSGQYSRLFDFGSGPESDNIFCFIYNGNLGVGIYPTGPNTANANQFQAQNVYSACNDNKWRHMVWTISADGYTWKIYINKVLQATITSSTTSSYSVGIGGNLLAPFHPRSMMRTSNYIGKSNWPDAVYNGSIDDFQMYNYPMDQTTIHQTWNMDTGGSLIPKYARERLTSETSMLVSTTTNPNYIIYPPFFTGIYNSSGNLVSNGMTFAFWFKSNSNPNWYRLFDFGNGPTGVNIGIFTYGLNIGVFVNGIGFYNVVPNCNDNVWRHLVWTISSDGLTYTFYINKTVVTMINSSITGTNSYTNPTYGSFYQNPPCHPELVLRSSNYILKSNQPNETLATLNASMHAFQMWNSTLDQTAINALYTDNAFAGTYTLSQFPDIQALYGSTSFVIKNPVSTGSGLFTFTSSNTSVATIVDNVVTLVGVGSTIITATQWTSSITATLTVIQPVYTPVLTNNVNTNYLVTSNGSTYDVGQSILRNIQQTVNIKNGLQTIGFGSTVNVYKKNLTCSMNGISQVGDTQISFGKSKKSMWVGVGQGLYPIGYSYDGINWKGIAASFEGIGVAYNGTIWVVVGRAGSGPDFAISYDGINWTEKTSGLITSATWFSDIVWNGKMFVAAIVNNAKSLAYSYDGSNWTLCGGAVATFNGNGNSIAWNGRQWVGCGGGTYQLGYSMDGVNWNPSGTAVFSGGTGYSVAWNGAMWLAVGSGTNNIAYSYDGLNWTGIGKGPIDTYTSGIAWNGKLWVVVGSGATHSIAYSYDGKVWIGLGIATLSMGRRVSWNGTMFVAVGSGTNPMAYSYDGINWVTLGSPFSALRHSVANNNTLENQIVVKRRTYIAVGQGANTLAYSYDGFTWRGLGTSIFDSYGRGVAYNGKLWVAVGTYNNTIAYSLDGIIWNGLGRSAIDSWGAGIGYNGSLWIAVGSGTYKMATSTTGTSFTGIASPFTDTCHGIAWNGKLWVAAGYGTNTLAWSTNGTTWTTITSPPLASYAFGVTWNGTLFVACGEGTNSICWSPDGKTWTAGTNSSGGSTTTLGTRFYSARWNGTLWLAAGSGPTRLVYSYDGKMWYSISNIPFTGQAANVLWDGKKWLAAGIGTNILAYSYDGMNWNGMGISFFTSNTNWLAYDALEPDVSIYMSQPTVAVGTGKVISYSVDGFTWTQSITPRLTIGYCAGHNGILWVAGGTGTYTMAYSSDGITWNPVLTSKAIFSTQVRGIAWNGTLWVAGGSGTNTLAYSYDGINWTPVTNSFLLNAFTVAWNGTMFVVVGDKISHSMVYSYDGQTWYGSTSPILNVYGVAYGNMWIAVGSGPTDSMAYSYDGISWTGLGFNVFTTAQGIAYNGTMWIATGTGSHTLAYSYDGFAWTGLGTSIFSTFGYAVSWNGNKWIATGTGTNTLAYSVDGLNWVGLGVSALDAGYGVASQTDYRFTTDSLSFSTESYQNGYKNLTMGVKGTLY